MFYFFVFLFFYNSCSHESSLVSHERACTPTCRSVSCFPGQDCIIGAAAVSITTRYIRQFDVQNFNPAARTDGALTSGISSPALASPRGLSSQTGLQIQRWVRKVDLALPRCPVWDLSLITGIRWLFVQLLQKHQEGFNPNLKTHSDCRIIAFNDPRHFSRLISHNFVPKNELNINYEYNVWHKQEKLTELWFKQSFPPQPEHWNKTKYKC